MKVLHRPFESSGLDSEGRCNTFHSSFYREVVATFNPSPHGYTWQQRAELWARYRAGDPVHEIARDLAKDPGALARRTGAHVTRSLAEVFDEAVH